MKKLLALLSSVALVVALIACGGEGGSTSFSPTTRSVQKIQQLSFLSMANSGLFLPGFFYGGSGGGGSTTGSGTGGGPGMSVGGFVRYFNGPGGFAPDGGTTGSGTVGGGGGTGNEYFYFDEWLQLWVDSQWTETSYTSLFYLDVEKTQPAGHMTSTFADNWEVYPQVYTSEYEFTGGTQAGSHGTYNCTQVDATQGSMTYGNHYTDGAHDQGTSTWSVTGSHWEARWDSATGTSWFSDSGDWSADGSGTYSCANSDGWSADWIYHTDWSGSAHFEGPDPLLPANLTWTSDGHYHIVYASGLEESWTWEDIWGSGSGVGTSGSTDGGESTSAGGSAGTTGQGTSGSTG